MKRDFDLVRRILPDVEKLPAGDVLEDLEYAGEYEQATIYAHIELLLDAGLLKGESLGGIGNEMLGFHVTGLTWKGYDFLNASRDDTLWAKAKSSILKPSASVTFDLLLEWLKVQAKTKLGLS